MKPPQVPIGHANQKPHATRLQEYGKKKDIRARKWKKAQYKKAKNKLDRKKHPIYRYLKDSCFIKLDEKE